MAELIDLHARDLGTAPPSVAGEKVQTEAMLPLPGIEAWKQRQQKLPGKNLSLSPVKVQYPIIFYAKVSSQT